MTGPSARLAIDGGTPVRSMMLPYGRHLVPEEDVRAVAEVLRSDWLTTGPTVGLFEERFAASAGASHAVAVSSGTAALHAAAAVAGIGPGDEVVVPALTFVATANCVRYVGATVVFADLRPDTLCLDSADVERRLTDRTKAIVTVDYAGQPSDLDELGEIARLRGLILMEDAAHAVGASYRGRPVGAIADLTAFSLHPVKHMTTGEGGVVTTADPSRAEALRRFRNHGISADARARDRAGSWAYDVVDLGFNYRLTDFQCALGLAQLARVPGWLERRAAIARRYTEALGEVPELELIRALPDRVAAWHLFVVRIRPEMLRTDRLGIYRALRAENIGVNVHYIPVPHLTLYRRLGYEPGGWPVAEGAYERMITLPLWAGMSDADVDDVLTAVRKVIAAYRR